MKYSIKEQIKIRIKEKRAEYEKKRKKKFLYLKHKRLLGNYYKQRQSRRAKTERVEKPNVEKPEVKIIKESFIKKLIRLIIKLCTRIFAIFAIKKSSKKNLPEE